MIVIYLVTFFILTFLLIKSADFVLDSIRGISRVTGTKTYILSAILLSIATSLPELFVGITSSISGVPSLSLGNILGANITNLTLVVGLSALIVGSISIHGNVVKKEMVMATLAGVMPFFLSIDGNLTRVDGLILLTVYIAFVTSFFKIRFIEIGSHFFEHNFVLRIVQKISNIERKTDKSIGKLFVGIAALLFSSDLIVKLAKIIAGDLNMPMFVVGLVILSLGTTLPELAVSFRALKVGQPSIFFGNLMGSIIVNSTLILGIVALINPISSVIVSSEIVTSLFFVLSFILFWFFVKSKNTLEKWEGATLLCIYLIFIVVQFI